MSGYIVLVDDVAAFDNSVRDLQFKASRLFNVEFAVYRPLPFVDYTGYAATVAEEIEYVIHCQQSNGTALRNSAQFIRSWHWEQFLDHPVTALSGGWRKFLGVSLFTNLRANGKLYIDVSSHLADNRLRLLSEQIAETADTCVLLGEYDSIMTKSFFHNAGFAYDCGDRLEIVPAPPLQAPLKSQSNYERTASAKAVIQI